MRLFVAGLNGKKVYIRKYANTRKELADKIGSKEFSIDGKTFNIANVEAEGSDSTTIGMIIGAILGIIAPVIWPLGIILGIAFGWFIAYEEDKKESTRARCFNESRSEWEK